MYFHYYFFDHERFPIGLKINIYFQAGGVQFALVTEYQRKIAGAGAD